MNMNKKMVAAAVSLAVGQAIGATSPTSPLPIYQDNVQWQRAVAIAGDGQGKFVQVWQDSNGGVWAQYSNAGSLLGAPFKVGQIGGGSAKRAMPDLSVDMNSSGDAVVAFPYYAGETYYGDVDFGYDVVQRIPANSTGVTSLPAPVVTSLGYSDVAMDNTGNFAVAGLAVEVTKTLDYVDYYGYKYYEYDYSFTKPALQRFDENGNSLPVTPNGATGDYGSYGVVDAGCEAKTNSSVRKVTRNGGIAYGYYGSFATDSGMTENLFRRGSYYNPGDRIRWTLDDYSYSGDMRNQRLSLVEDPLIGSEALDSCRPSIAMNGAGSAVVTWANEGHIYARRYTAAGVLLDAPAITVDRTPADEAKWQTTGKGSGVSYIPVSPVVDMDSNGNFVVAWSLMKTKVKSFVPKDAAYEGQEPVIFKHELSASIKGQRFENGAPTHLVKGVAADAELVKETERVDQDLTIAFTGPGTFAVAWANRFEDFKQYSHIGVLYDSMYLQSTDRYVASTKGSVYLKRFTIDSKGTLKGSGKNVAIATASSGTADGDEVFNAHWLPAISGDQNGNISVLWQTQKHLDEYFQASTNFYQMDRFDSMYRYYPAGSK